MLYRQWMIKSVHVLPWFTVDHLLKAFGIPSRSDFHRKELLYLLSKLLFHNPRPQHSLIYLIAEHKMYPFVLPHQQYGFALNLKLDCIRFLSRVYKNNS